MHQVDLSRGTAVANVVDPRPCRRENSAVRGRPRRRHPRDRRYHRRARLAAASRSIRRVRGDGRARLARRPPVRAPFGIRRRARHAAGLRVLQIARWRAGPRRRHGRGPLDDPHDRGGQAHLQERPRRANVGTIRGGGMDHAGNRRQARCPLRRDRRKHVVAGHRTVGCHRRALPRHGRDQVALPRDGQRRIQHGLRSSRRIG